MGMGGKLIVATGQTANLQSIWFRILCLFQENSNDLNFLQDINDYRLEGNKSQTTLLTGKFKDKFVSMAKKRIKKILLRKFLLWKVFAGLFFLFVPFYCMSLEESFNFKRCVLWILYSFLTFVHANITVIMVFSISGIWHISRYHCQLLTEQLISKIQAIIDGIDSTTSQKLSRDLRDFESSFFVCQERIRVFNRFSKHFVSGIAVSSSLVLSLMSLSVLRSECNFSYILLPSILMMSIEPMAVMASSTSLYSLSRQLYQRLNECFVRIPWTQSLHQRFVFKSILKDVASEKTSITLIHGDNSSCDPMDFTDFIASGVSNFILLISLVDEVQAHFISK